MTRSVRQFINGKITPPTFRRKMQRLREQYPEFVRDTEPSFWATAMCSSMKPLSPFSRSSGSDQEEFRSDPELSCVIAADDAL